MAAVTRVQALELQIRIGLEPSDAALEETVLPTSTAVRTYRKVIALRALREEIAAAAP